MLRLARARHFVYVSFEHERTPDSPLVQAKRNVEAHVRASGMTYTILRPGLFMESWLGFGGPGAISQREALAMFQEAFGRSFEVSEIPEAALETQWREAADPFHHTFASLMLGVARGMGSEMPPPREGYDVPFTRVRDWVREAAK